VAVTGRGLDMVGDVALTPPSFLFAGLPVPDAGAAIVLRQDGTKNRKAIAWTTRNPAAMATLVFDPDTSVFRLAGGTALDVTGARLTRTGGLSGTATPPANLRAIRVTVPPGATTFPVPLPKPEPDTDYAAFVTTSWLTQVAVPTRQTSSFTVLFSQPAPPDAKIDWLLVR
jgi:hypothetical protein